MASFDPDMRPATRIATHLGPPSAPAPFPHASPEATRVMVAVAPVLPCQKQYLGLHKGQNGLWYRIHCISHQDAASPSLLESVKKAEIIRQTALIINGLKGKTAANHIVIEQGTVTVGFGSNREEISEQPIDSQLAADYNSSDHGLYAIDEQKTTFKDVARAINHLLSDAEPEEQEETMSPLSSRGPSPVAVNMIFSPCYYKKEDKKPREDSPSPPSSVSLPLKQSPSLPANESKKTPIPAPHGHAPKIATPPSLYAIPSFHDVGSSDDEGLLDYMTDQSND